MRRDRPARCYVCSAPATINDQRLRERVTLPLDGAATRSAEWVGRYLCPAHEHLDAWTIEP